MLKNKKSFIFYNLFSIILFFYLIYKVVYLKSFFPDYYFIYFIISSIIFLFSFVIWFLKKKTIIYINIIFFSFFFALYTFELFLSLNLDYETKARAKKANEQNLEYDTRNIIEFYNDTNTNNDLTIFLRGGENKKKSIYTLSGLSNKKTILCNESGTYIIYKSDKFGFRNKNTSWEKKDFEYLLLGDSFVHGSCVNDKDTISSKLEEISKKNTINLGISGFGPLHQYASLREYMLKPTKNILWFYWEGNDLQNLNEELQNPYLKNYLEDDSYTQLLHKNQEIIDQNIKDHFNYYIKKSNFVKDFLKLYKTRIFLLNPHKVKPEINIPGEFEKILIKTKNLAQNSKAKLWFIYLPQYVRYKDTNYKNKNYLKVKEILKKLDIPIIDIHEKYFLKEKNPLKSFYFELRSHYTADAYDKITRIIYNNIK